MHLCLGYTYQILVYEINYLIKKYYIMVTYI